MKTKRMKIKQKPLPRLRLASKKAFGLNEVIGIAAGIIIAAAIVIPGLRTFAQGLITKLNTWWTTMANDVFQ